MEILNICRVNFNIKVTFDQAHRSEELTQANLHRKPSSRGAGTVYIGVLRQCSEEEQGQIM